MNRPTIIALAVALTLGAAACGQSAGSSTTTPAATTEATAPVGGSPFAGASASATPDPDEQFATDARINAPSVNADLARGRAQLTCRLLDEGDNPGAVIIGAYRAAKSRGYDLADIGYVMGAGVRIYCPDQLDTYSTTVDAMRAVLDETS